MKNNKFAKLLVLVLTLATLVVSAFGIAALAEENTQLDILAQNVVYGEKISVAYAVNATLEDANAGTVKVAYYWEDDATVKYATLLDTTVENNVYKDKDGNKYPVFVTEGVAAKEMLKTVYAMAYTGDTAPTAPVYSDYSVAEYLYTRLYRDGFAAKTEADGDDYLRAQLYHNTLEYGASAQSVLVNIGKDEADKVTLVTECLYAYTTSEDVTVNGGRYAMGVDELTVSVAYIGDGSLEAWIITDSEGNETEVESSEITVDGVIAISPKLGVHVCSDTDNDHLCDICGETASECKNENSDHDCDICGKTLTECSDSGTDGKCDVCGVYVFEGESVIGGSNVTIRNITSTNSSFATDETTNTNSSSITTGAAESTLYGAYMYLDSPTAAASKVLAINTYNGGGATPTGSTKENDYCSDIIFTPDVEVENGDLVVLEFDYYLDALTSTNGSNGYLLLWYLDYSGETADSTVNGVYSYNKGTPRLNADSNKLYSFAKQTWVRIRLVCDNTNKKLYTYISSDGGATYNTCATISDLDASVDNIGLSFNVYRYVSLQYIDNIVCVQTNAATYGITFE